MLPEIEKMMSEIGKMMLLVKITEGLCNYEMILLLVKNDSMIEEKIKINGFRN